MNLDCKIIFSFNWFFFFFFSIEIRLCHVILVYENSSVNILEIGLVSRKQETNKIDFAISNKQLFSKKYSGTTLSGTKT